MDISEITIEKIKNGKLAKELPEIYELKNIIENGRFHLNESVFDHTVAMAESLNDLIEQAGQNDLAKMVENHSKKQLLIIAAIFHDLGKKEALVSSDGKTSCLGHERVSAEKTKNILKRFNLPADEVNYIVTLVSNHGRLHDLMDLIGSKDFKAAYDKVRNDLPKIIHEITLLTKADIISVNMKNISPKDYNIRMNFLDNLINEY